MRSILTLAGVAAAYFVAGKLGLSLAYVNESTTAVWPPAGIAVASLLLFGVRVWPAVAVGALAVNLTTSGSLVASFVIAGGNTAEAVAAWWLVDRFANGRAAFDRTPDIARFSVLAALAAPMVAATIGTAALIATGLATGADAPSIWVTWWLGDASGVLFVTPLIVLWAARWRQPWTVARAAEALVLAGAVAAAAAIVFGNTPVGARHLQAQFVLIPLLLWAAFRFGARETAAAAAVVSLFAVPGTLAGFGPFARSSPNDSLLILQGFLAVITLVMLSVAAEVAARARLEAEMRAMNEALEQHVRARTEDLRRAHDRLAEAQRVAHVGSWEWDLSAGTLWWSGELYRIYGLDPSAPVTYDAYLALVHPGDRDAIRTAVARAADTGGSFSFDHQVIRPDGGVRILHGEGRVITGADGRAIRMMGTGHDITERVASEEQRAQLKIAEAARQDAEAASRSKDQFLATLAHELRTPLNVALGWTQLLRREPMPGPALRGVEKIGRNLDMLGRLVSDIFDVARVTSGALRLAIDNVDMTSVVREVVDTVRETASARGITVEAAVASSLPPLKGDAQRLQQVLWNLLSNAVKFVPDGGRIVLSVRSDAGAVEIVVEDDGPGIDPGFLPHVFEQFRQADSSTTREHGGLGLGLSIARHLVELHDGQISAANRPQGGAAFTVRLPAASAPDEVI
jgi:PAS domain S-box-containing protein